jgi:ribonuclease HI
MNEEIKEVTLYTDGACEPNPGSGGWGVVLIYGNHRKELSGGFQLSTNNRMEIIAAIKGLETLKAPCKVTLYSDSEYLVNAMMQGWVRRWQRDNWWRNKEEKAANVDLWGKLLDLCNKHQVEFVWIKAHAGNPENERCDQLSLEALKQDDLTTDEGYQKFVETKDASKIKVTSEGQPCRSCSTPVIKRTPRSKRKPDQLYYYEYYLYCPKCHAIYLVEEAKRYFE